MKVLVVLIALCSLAAGRTLYARRSRIINGVPTTIEEYPTQASLRYSDTHTCGAVLLSATQQMTAARCVDGRIPTGFELWYGSTNRLTGGTLVSVTDTVQHPDYDPTAEGFPNDIATVTVDVVLDGVTAAAAVLPSGSDDFVGQVCAVTGWGRIDETNALPEDLLKADLTIIDNTECAERMSLVPGASIQPGHICPFDTTSTTGACNGDFGGPLHCQEAGLTVVAGVSSWFYDSFGECRTSHPSVYTRVASYLDWLP